MSFWLAGIVAGLIGGVVMAAVATMAMMMQKQLMPVKVMAGTFQGEAALEGGMPTLMLGMMIHFVMAGFFGLIYALIVHALGWSGLFTFIWSGIAYALIVFGVNQYLVLPTVDIIMAQRMNPMAFAMSHVFYGVMGWLFWVFHGPYA